MAREFYTEKDIEDLVKRGVLSLQVTDDVVLTELAYEKANRLGLKLVHGAADTPPAAPVRPYLSQGPLYQKPAPAPAAQTAPAARTAASAPPSSAARSAPTPPGPGKEELHQRIRSAVIAKLGSQVDGGLLDAIITRVLNSTGVK